MKSLLIVSVSITLLLTLTMIGCGSQPTPEKPTPTALPAVKGVQAGETIIAEGRVMPVKSTALSFSIAGIVNQVAVALGDQVQAGQVIAQQDTNVLDLQLKEAEANLTAAQAKLNQLAHGPTAQDLAAAEQNVISAQATYDQLKAGPDASKVTAAKAALAAAQQNYAKVRAGPTANELAALKAQMDNAQASVNQAQAAYDRIGGAGNPQSAMTSQARALQEATNNYKAAVAAYNGALNHPTASELAAAQSQVQQAQAALDTLTPNAAQLAQALAAVQNAKAQQAKLQPSADERAALEASVNAARAARDLAAQQLKNAKLVAPFTGTITAVNVDAGEFAAPGAVVAQLADTSAWQIETTDLTELNVVEVMPGTPVTMTFDAIPGLELPGKVTKISPFGETRQGDIVYTVFITPAQQESRLRWNMTAKVSIETTSR